MHQIWSINLLNAEWPTNLEPLCSERSWLNFYCNIYLLADIQNSNLQICAFSCMFIPMLVNLFNGALNTGLLPVESSSLDIVISICSSLEFPSDKLLAEISRVLKPGGTVLIQKTAQSNTAIKDVVTIVQFTLF